MNPSSSLFAQGTRKRRGKSVHAMVTAPKYLDGTRKVLGGSGDRSNVSTESNRRRGGLGMLGVGQRRQRPSERKPRQDIGIGDEWDRFAHRILCFLVGTRKSAFACKRLSSLQNVSSVAFGVLHCESSSRKIPSAHQREHNTFDESIRGALRRSTCIGHPKKSRFQKR